MWQAAPVEITHMRGGMDFDVREPLGRVGREALILAPEDSAVLAAPSPPHVRRSTRTDGLRRTHGFPWSSHEFSARSEVPCIMESTAPGLALGRGASAAARQSL